MTPILGFMWSPREAAPVCLFAAVLAGAPPIPFSDEQAGSANCGVWPETPNLALSPMRPITWPLGLVCRGLEMESTSPPSPNPTPNLQFKLSLEWGRTPKRGAEPISPAAQSQGEGCAWPALRTHHTPDIARHARAGMDLNSFGV